ncbi:MAG TPA: hypothetical protein PKY82_27235 [Pyrinomonadaceae bacterium]|nr:hypothetical protein [Pyrinomonadaceae bacterium]
MRFFNRKFFTQMAVIFILMTCVLLDASQTFAQRRQVKPPRVEGQTVIGTINGVPVTANDIIMTINYDSPFMPPLDGSPVPILQQFEANYTTTTPTPQTSPTPTTTPKPVAPSFSVQIQNMMKTGQEWLFKSLLDVIIKPAMPVLIFFAWIIASFILGIGFLRRFSDNKGISPEQLTRWGIRSIVFMVIIGASPFIIDMLTVTGNFIARPIKSFNRELVAEFDEKMKKYVKTNFAVEDPNALLAERLPNGEPGLIGIIFDKESSVKDVTSEMNILGWDMTRLFTLMVVSQNIIKFGGLFLGIAGLFILIGLKLAAPVLSAFGFDEKFANQIFYPFCWGVATFSLAFPIVKEITLYVAYGIGLIGLSIYNGETVFTLDPNTAQIITNGNYDPASSALIVTLLFFVSCLCYILVPWLSYRVLRGQVFEGVSQISMGWMLSTVGTALETYGLVAGAAINRQAENTQIQGIYNAEQASAKKGLEASNLSTEARRVSSVAGVEGGLVSSLGQIRANQVTQTMIANANRNFGILSSQASTTREIATMKAENTGMQNIRSLDGIKENALRSQGTNQAFGMLKYEAIPGGGNIPIRKGVEFYDYMKDQHILQQSTGTMNRTTTDTYQLQNQNTQYVTEQKIDASQTYQNEMNSAFNRQAAETIGAVNAGTNIAAGSAKQGAGIQISGINTSAGMEKQANQLNFEGRMEAATINEKAATSSAHLRMMSTVVTGFFRDMDRRIEEMKPKY